MHICLPTAWRRICHPKGTCSTGYRSPRPTHRFRAPSASCSAPQLRVRCDGTSRSVLYIRSYHCIYHWLTSFSSPRSRSRDSRMARPWPRRRHARSALALSRRTRPSERAGWPSSHGMRCSCLTASAAAERAKASQVSVTHRVPVELGLADCLHTGTCLMQAGSGRLRSIKRLPRTRRTRRSSLDRATSLSR